MPFEITRGILKKYTGNDGHVVIPTDVTEIGDYAFSSAVMRTVSIPDTVSAIGTSAFYNCRNLEEIVIPDSVRYVRDGLFSRCLNLKKAVLPDQVTALGKITFFQCESLESVKLPSHLEIIRRACFQQCHSLKTLQLPASLKQIDDNVFDDCTSLEEVSLPVGLKTIGDNTFFGCSSLKRLDIPESVTAIGKGALETRGTLQLTVHAPIRITAKMLDNNWNLNWNNAGGFNFGANGHYNGKNEDNYRLVDSLLPDVDLSRWKPFARCVLAVNYLETYRKDDEQYIAWIRENTDECLRMMVSLKRYTAMNTALEHGFITPQQAEPYLDLVEDRQQRSILLSYARKTPSMGNDLLDLL